MSDNFQDREDARAMTECALFQKYTLQGKILCIIIDLPHEITAVTYFKKYNPSARLEDISVSDKAIKSYLLRKK